MLYYDLSNLISYNLIQAIAGAIAAAWLPGGRPPAGRAARSGAFLQAAEWSDTAHLKSEDELSVVADVLQYVIVC